MSKITFRADDELIEELEEFDQSKSEVMRQALREYLASHPNTDVNAVETSDSSEKSLSASEDTLDDFLAERVDRLIERRLDDHLGARKRASGAQDVNVNITLDGDSGVSVEEEDESRKTNPPDASDADENERKTCSQCGENVGSEHVYCPNCGEKVSRRVFCECGDEIRSDWAFCPGCGRRTPAADVLDSA